MKEFCFGLPMLSQWDGFYEWVYTPWITLGLNALDCYLANKCHSHRDNWSLVITLLTSLQHRLLNRSLLSSPGSTNSSELSKPVVPVPILHKLPDCSQALASGNPGRRKRPCACTGQYTLQLTTMVIHVQLVMLHKERLGSWFNELKHSTLIHHLRLSSPTTKCFWKCIGLLQLLWTFCLFPPPFVCCVLHCIYIKVWVFKSVLFANHLTVYLVDRNSIHILHM